MTSAINTNMILGYFHTYQINDKEVYLYYTPCTQQKISEILSMLTDDTSAEITFPFSTLDDVLQEYLVTSKAWDSLDTEQLTNLDHDELHFRNITANYLYNQETSQKVFYDPACSTGTFLGHLKQLFPSGIYIGSDQSKEMVHLAQNKLDYVFQAEASALQEDIQVDYLFLRFLNMEVVTIKQAYDLFEHLIRLLKKDGQIIIFGHTPVLLNIQYIVDKYELRILRRIGFHNHSAFQYYILQKLS
ncbi:hypothetical protein BK704_13080 [[Bacillus thuringiensis] serovar konkukian]|nr:hypothetical protein BK704_13080 [[Bacillus thuringiensis] serovar konkukian]